MSRRRSPVGRPAFELSDPFLEGSNIVLASGPSAVFVSIVDAFSIIDSAYFAGHLTVTFRSSESMSPSSALSTYFSRQVLHASVVLVLRFLRTASSPEIAPLCIDSDMVEQDGSEVTWKCSHKLSRSISGRILRVWGISGAISAEVSHLQGKLLRQPGQETERRDKTSQMCI